MLLRKLVSHGQAIMCTIHQPSSVLLGLFDQLLLLAKPGKTIYWGPLGPDSKIMIEYFERLGARPCRKEENPAEWVLDVTRQHRREAESWSWLWNQSPEKAALTQELLNITSRRNIASGISSDHYAASSLPQIHQVLKRMMQEHWRTPTYLWSMFALCFGTASHTQKTSYL